MTPREVFRLYVGKNLASRILRPEVEGRGLVSRAPECRKLCSWCMALLLLWFSEAMLPV